MNIPDQNIWWPIKWVPISSLKSLKTPENVNNSTSRQLNAILWIDVSHEASSDSARKLGSFFGQFSFCQMYFKSLLRCVGKWTSNLGIFFKPLRKSDSIKAWTSVLAQRVFLPVDQLHTVPNSAFFSYQLFHFWFFGINSRNEMKIFQRKSKKMI